MLKHQRTGTAGQEGRHRRDPQGCQHGLHQGCRRHNTQRVGASHHMDDGCDDNRDQDRRKRGLGNDFRNLFSNARVLNKGSQGSAHACYHNGHGRGIDPVVDPVVQHLFALPILTGQQKGKDTASEESSQRTSDECAEIGDLRIGNQNRGRCIHKDQSQREQDREQGSGQGRKLHVLRLPGSCQEFLLGSHRCF